MINFDNQNDGGIDCCLRGFKLNHNIKQVMGWHWMGWWWMWINKNWN